MRVRNGYYPEQHRNESFKSILEKLPLSQSRVYYVIEEYQPITLNMIAKVLDKYPNEVSGRVTELVALGLIEYAGEGSSDRSAKPVSTYKVVDPCPQMSLF